MNNENRNDLEESSEISLRDVDWSERKLIYRGKRSCFYKVYWREKNIWFGLKEEKCTQPITILSVMNVIQKIHSNFLLHHYDAYTVSDTTIIVLTEIMDYTLKDIWHRYQRLTECQIKAIAYLTLHALIELHEKVQIVHGDINPSNIFLRRSGELKLGDLSSAIPINSIVEQFSGTIFYTPLEVLKDSQLASSLSNDIWALGVILYQSVEGDHPFVKTCNDNFWSFFLAMEEAYNKEKKIKLSSNITNNFYDFLNTILQWKPDQRPTAQSLITHPWFLDFNVDIAQHELSLMAFE